MENLRFQAIDYTQRSIYNYADKMAQKFNFQPGSNIENIINSLGGKLKYVDYEEYKNTEDGSIVVRGQKDFDIFVSQTNNYARNRFTIAHEIGHYMLHSKFGSIKGRAQRFPSMQINSSIEIEANWFAASFLMPLSHFKDTCKFGLLKNAGKFGVSLETAEYRYDTFVTENF